jgi:hypothetical protein
VVAFQQALLRANRPEPAFDHGSRTAVSAGGRCGNPENDVLSVPELRAAIAADISAPEQR